MKGLVFSENLGSIREMLSFLDGKMDADVAFTGDMGDAVLSCKKIYHMRDHPYDPQPLAAALKGIYSSGYDYFFAGSTTTGREVAAMLAQDLGLAMESEIISFEQTGNEATISRFFYGGKTIMRKQTSARAFTVMSGVAAQAVSDASLQPQVTEVELQPGGLKLISREEKRKGSVDLAKADVIVAVGRGLGKREGIEIARQLASALGAELAGSRPICSDLHWLEEERQVGLSGKRVKPRIYVALGISGQIQHLVGMRDSRTVIAINKDKSAPIFNECDYGIVGDIYTVVPMLIQALKP